MAVLPTASESPLVYAYELWVFAMCPALWGSTVSYTGDAHFSQHNLEYSLNFWSQSRKKKNCAERLLEGGHNYRHRASVWDSKAVGAGALGREARANGAAQESAVTASPSPGGSA